MHHSPAQPADVVLEFNLAVPGARFYNWLRTGRQRQTRKKERMSAAPEEPTLFDSLVKPKLSPAYPNRAPWGTSVHLRAWQAEAMQKYFETNPRDRRPPETLYTLRC